MSKAKKEKKKWTERYELKLAINGSFEDVIGVSGNQAQPQNITEIKKRIAEIRRRQKEVVKLIRKNASEELGNELEALSVEFKKLNAEVQSYVK